MSLRSCLLALALSTSWAEPALRGASVEIFAYEADADNITNENETEDDVEGMDNALESAPSAASRPGMPPLSPMRAIAYGALPCALPIAAEWAPEMMSCNVVGLPSEDMMQDGYEAQWGPLGRNDLGLMKSLGGNAVRLYHSLGLGGKGSHKGFLDRANELRINVMPGFHSTEPALCNNFDCFEAWKTAAATGFKQGFQVEDGWHPAVSTVILMNEPDFWENDPLCTDQGAWCRVKAVISALDGVLAAEEEAKISAGDVKLAVTWSFAMRTSIDGKVQGPGTFGFQDMIAVVEDPSLVEYVCRTPQEKLKKAFYARWVHGLNTQAPWTFVRDFVTNHYQLYDGFGGFPWFIGEYGANGQTRELIVSDLQPVVAMMMMMMVVVVVAASASAALAVMRSMEEKAMSDQNFLGSAFFQFQTAYSKGGSELNFGLFSIGKRKIGETGEVCDRKSHCRTWPVYCLGTKLPWFDAEPALGKRAEALATAWGGVAEGTC